MVAKLNTFLLDLASLLDSLQAPLVWAECPCLMCFSTIDAFPPTIIKAATKVLEDYCIDTKMIPEKCELPSMGYRE